MAVQPLKPMGSMEKVWSTLMGPTMPTFQAPPASQPIPKISPYSSYQKMKAPGAILAMFNPHTTTISGLLVPNTATSKM